MPRNEAINIMDVILIAGFWRFSPLLSSVF